MYDYFITSNVHPSWIKPLNAAFAKMDANYLLLLQQTSDWLPGREKMLNAFSLPLNKTQYILFGESPYPRETSANGYAFWDAAVGEIWSDTGLSSTVNRATSLRNIIKMLLVAEKQLSPNNTSQTAISEVNKANYIKSLSELFNNLHNKGFLMLNATLVLRNQKVKEDGLYWKPFIEELLKHLPTNKVQLILFGKIAQMLDKLAVTQAFRRIYSEHPYNLSFINNPEILAFFEPLHLLHASSKTAS